MVIAAVCPVHGAQQSRMFHIFNSASITLSGNTESCPVLGCRHMMAVMDGQFEFIGEQVEVISAPRWSIGALEEVARRVGETVRMLADPETSDAAATAAAQGIEPDIERAVAQLPVSVAAKIMGALRTTPGEDPVESRKRMGLVLALVFFLLLNYETVKDNVGAMVDDAAAVATWAADQAEDLPSWFRDEVIPWLDGDAIKTSNPHQQEN